MQVIKHWFFYILILVAGIVITTQYLQFRQSQELHKELIALEKNCLKNALYYEARSEGKLGIIAVASVIENRKNSGKYPNDYCKVINQHKQFSYTLEGRPDVEAIEGRLRAADKVAYVQVSKVTDEMLEGRFEPVLPSTVMHYAVKKISNTWTRTKKIYATIGNHNFYKEKEPK